MIFWFLLLHSTCETACAAHLTSCIYCALASPSGQRTSPSCLTTDDTLNFSRNTGKTSTRIRSNYPPYGPIGSANLRFKRDCDTNADSLVITPLPPNELEETTDLINTSELGDTNTRIFESPSSDYSGVSPSFEFRIKLSYPALTKNPIIRDVEYQRYQGTLLILYYLITPRREP